LKRWMEARGITWKKPFLTEAPILILVFGRIGEPYWVESTWLAIGFMLLAIQELGYSTLTYTPSKPIGQIIYSRFQNNTDFK